MKHTLKVTIILISMFLVAQLIGIFVASQYLPETVQIYNNQTQTFENQEVYDLPYGVTPPEDTNPTTSIISIVIALIIAIFLMFILMKIKAEWFLRVWFFVVVALGIAIALNAFLIKLPNATTLALIIAIPLAFVKIFQRNIIVHNMTELLIYPGIASVFIPILNLWSVIVLLVIISLYDIYAVWHAGFMQKMAKYQIENLRVFSGFFVPYLGRKERAALKKASPVKAKSSKAVKSSKTKSKEKKVGINIAILGGGDVVFPIILAGVVLRTLGLTQAILIALGATAALAYLFYKSEKGKFYPAMPFISIGCLVGLLIGFMI